MLSTLGLDCPALESLDATFCGRLGKSALAWVVNSSPPLHTLVLSVCSHLDANALEALGTLHTLRLLDLSYTEIQACSCHFPVILSFPFPLCASCGRCSPMIGPQGEVQVHQAYILYVQLLLLRLTFLCLCIVSLAC